MKLALALVLAAACVAADEDKKDETGTVIGIDLGTTYSCVGVMRKGKVEILPNDQGNRITPSYVAWDDKDERLIGDAAKNQATLRPTKTVFDVKRLIGRLYGDAAVQHDKKLVPYKIANEGGKPMVQVDIKGEKERFTPEQVSSMILGKMKEIAERFLGEDVKNAVVTVPAYFNDAQRQATKAAGTIAGLNVMRIINEPTAAAIAYGLDKKKEAKGGKTKEQVVLVFDLGGGTFDVTLLTIDNGVFEVMATNGNTHLGGEDFDQRTMQHFVKIFKKKTGKDLSKDKRALQKLRRECERVKRALSSQKTAKLEIDSLMDGEDLVETLTRAKFEELNIDLFKKTMGPVKKVMKDGGIEKSEVDEIVLVGGSTRIPKVQELLKKFFGGKKPNTGINPDEAVAYGAAVQGGILGGEAEEETKDLLLLDVAPLSLGTEVVGGLLDVLIKRNTVIPTKTTKDYTTVQDNQAAIDVTVYEGERSKAKKNHLLGEFKMPLIPAKRGVPHIKLTFEIDANGILKVTAFDTGTGKKKQITVSKGTGRLSEAEIAKMAEEAEAHAEEDKKFRENTEAKQALEHYLYSSKTALEDDSIKSNMDEEDLKELVEAVNEATGWLEKNDEAEKDAFIAKKSEVQKVVDPVLKKFTGDKGGGGDDEDMSFDDSDEEEL
jgi:heat shock protein 5